MPTEPLQYHVDIFRIIRNPIHGSKVLEVSGWCFTPSRREPMQLALRADGQALLELTCNLERKDVAAAFPALRSTSCLPLCGFAQMIDLVDGPHHRFELVSSDGRCTLAQASVAELEGTDDPLACFELDGPVSFAGFLRRVRRRARAKVNYRTALSPTRWRQWLRQVANEYRLYRVESQMTSSPASAGDTAVPITENRIEVVDQPRDDTVLSGRPLKVACFTHNLNIEGATKVMLDTALGLSASGRFTPTVVSPFDGPARHRVESRGLTCRIIRLPGTEDILAGWRKPADCERSREIVCEFLADERPDVVVAIVLNNFFVIEAAARLSIPSLWLVQESHHRAAMVRSVNPFALPAVERAFGLAHRVIFASKRTSELYQRYNQKQNFRVIYNALTPEDIAAAAAGPGKEEARRLLGIPMDKKVILSVGTVCPRKDQATLARGFRLLAQRRHDFLAYIIGARPGDPYVRSVARILDRYAVADRVKLVSETADVHTYYRAADLFAFSSLNECFPLVILEAMIYGLPIVTTKCIGVSEQVRFGLNAISFEFGDAESLVKQIELLLDDDQRRESMGQHSRDVLGSMPIHQQIIQAYESLIVSAYEARHGTGA